MEDRHAVGAALSGGVACHLVVQGSRGSVNHYSPIFETEGTQRAWCVCIRTPVAQKNHLQKTGAENSAKTPEILSYPLWHPGAYRADPAAVPVPAGRPRARGRRDGSSGGAFSKERAMALFQPGRANP
jgi:hypothetical protein